MRSTFFLLIALAVGAKAAAAQGEPVRIQLRIPSNAIVRAYSPDSARFSLEGTDPIAHRDTLVLKDGAVLSYDAASGPMRFLITGVEPGQTVDILGSGERKSRWAAFITHSVSIGAQGPVHVPVATDPSTDPTSTSGGRGR